MAQPELKAGVDQLQTAFSQGSPRPLAVSPLSQRHFAHSLSVFRAVLLKSRVVASPLPSIPGSSTTKFRRRSLARDRYGYCNYSMRQFLSSGLLQGRCPTFLQWWMCNMSTTAEVSDDCLGRLTRLTNGCQPNVDVSFDFRFTLSLVLDFDGQPRPYAQGELMSSI
jgi:hypothetical protein